MTDAMAFTVVGLLIAGLISLFSIVRFGCRNIDSIESFLSNCKITKDYHNVFILAGLIGIFFRTAMAATVLIFPGMFRRHGLIDVDQVNSFPADLKRGLLIRAYVFWSFGIPLAVLAIADKIFNLS